MGILDLPGPRFLGLYVIIAAAAWTIGQVLRNLLRPPRGDVDVKTLNLTPVDVAYLADGEPQAIDAAVTSLAQRKVVTVDVKTRAITFVAQPPVDADSLERRLFSFFGKNGRTVESIRRDASPLFEPIREKLIRAGLLIADGQRWMTTFVPSLLLAAVLVLGLAKIRVGLSRDRPVSFLVLLCALTAGEALRLLGNAPSRSLRGDRALAALRAGNEGLHVTARAKPDGVSPDDLALAVGLYGATIIRTGAMADLGRVLRPPPLVTSTSSRSVRWRTSANWSGASSCSSCSSSSCGGGCGGGGCGGCGS